MRGDTPHSGGRTVSLQSAILPPNGYRPARSDQARLAPTARIPHQARPARPQIVKRRRIGSSNRLYSCAEISNERSTAGFTF